MAVSPRCAVGIGGGRVVSDALGVSRGWRCAVGIGGEGVAWAALCLCDLWEGVK